MHSVGIIGLGRFGEILLQMLQPHCEIKSFDIQHQNCDSLETTVQQQNVFIAVPIRHFQATIQDIAPLLTAGTTVIDVCSVKVYPVNIMQTYLKPDIDIIATHPLFGPDSYYNPQKSIMLSNIRDQYQRYSIWKDFFTAQQLQVTEITPEQHDRYMAQSQGLTHLIGRLLARIPATSTPINTPGYNQLLKIMEYTCNDSIELFYDLMRYNPYSNAENQQLLYLLQQLLQEIDHYKR